jgi:ElaB/YqjD/DUF883 family membrane-anchored ribosome-binding protein
MNKPHAKEEESTTGSRLHALANGAEHLAESASEQIDAYKARAQRMLHEANNTSLADIEKNVGGYIKANPGKSLLSAAAAGFVVGFLISRR